MELSATCIEAAVDRNIGRSTVSSVYVSLTKPFEVGPFDAAVYIEVIEGFQLRNLVFTNIITVRRVKCIIWSRPHDTVNTRSVQLIKLNAIFLNNPDMALL